MPRLTQPPGMPEEVARVVEAISNAVRTEILRSLSRKALTSMEISKATGVIHSSIHRHLVVLEELGLVKADRAPNQRRGREVRWQSIPEQVVRLGQEWIDYATGASRQGD